MLTQVAGKKRNNAHPEQVRNVKQARADPHVYICVDAIDEPGKSERYRKDNGGGGAPVLQT